MRILTSAVALAALLAFQTTPGQSQTTTQEPAPPAAAAPAPAPEAATPETTAPAATPAPAPHRAAKRHAKRMTLHQRFEAANAAKDGHLTPQEARAAKWTYVVRHFQAMDKDHKGYVTEADIHTYAHAQYEARQAARAAHAPTPAPAAPAPAAPASAAPAPVAPAPAAPAAPAPAAPAPAQQ